LQLGSLSCACALSWPIEKAELTTSRASKKSSSTFLRILTITFLLFLVVRRTFPTSHLAMHLPTAEAEVGRSQ
jgi:hypothetical protein